MRLALFNTPATRFTLLTALGLAALLTAVFYALQPETGVTADIAAWRPAGSVAPEMWISLGVGFGAYLISTWIWALKPADPAASLFAVSGVMTLLFTFAATDWFIAFPIPPGVGSLMGYINALAASAFGIVMICLFLIYPGRLPFWRWGVIITVIVFGSASLMRIFGPWLDFTSVHAVTFAEMLAIVAIVIWQVVAARTDPRQRAIALWVGASVLLGAGIFIATVAAPLTFGYPALIGAHYAFASFLLIYIGLAVGLIRYRLFELGGWAFQLVFHTAIAFAIFAIDAVLIGLMSLAPGMALGLSLFVIAFGYLPARDFIWRRLTRRRTADEGEIFRFVVETALKPSGPQRAASWAHLLQDLYEPLEQAEALAAVDSPRIEAEGLALYLPAAADSPALVLRYPHAGRTLFTPRDLGVASQIVALMRHVEESREGYDRGVSEERTRIARDIHDNIGAQLLRALHSGEPVRKDAMIRDTLADLRDVINNAQSTNLPLELILADLRAETADRLSPHDMSLRWTVEAGPELVIAPGQVHALRSFIREATSNAIRHARAAQVTVAIEVDGAALSVRVGDNGRGFAVDKVRLGHGLDNMKARVESLGGAFTLTSTKGGTELAAKIPLHREEKA